MKTRKILVSPGFGAGWTTWAYDENATRIMLEWEPIVKALEAGEGPLSESHPAVVSMLEKIAEVGGKDVYLGGLRDLEVHEVTGRVRILEYDGFESVEVEVTSTAGCNPSM